MNQVNEWLFQTQVPRSLRFELSRPQLLTTLEDHGDVKAIALLAPSGYGKTTLLAQYARAQQHPVAWLTLGPEMGDPHLLAQALASSILSAIPESSLPRFQQVGQEATQLTARALALDLVDTDVNLRLVLDQIQFLSPASAQWLDVFLQFLPEGHLLLMSGYEGTSLKLARLVAQQQVILLGSSQLAFTVEEGRVYLHARGMTQDIDLIYQRLEGWPAGLALTSVENTTYIHPEHLIREALQELPPALLDQLPDLGAVEVWSESLVQGLGLVMPHRWLAMLLSAGLPITPLGGEVYRPHHLILNELQRRLDTQPQRARAVYSKVGSFEERAGRLHQALIAFTRGHCPQDEQRILYRLLFKLTQRGEHAFALQVLGERDWRTLPPELQALIAGVLNRLDRQEEYQAIVEVLRQAEPQARRPEVARVLAEAAAQCQDYVGALSILELALAQPNSVFPDNHLDWTLRLQTSRVWVKRLMGDHAGSWQDLLHLIEHNTGTGSPFDQALLYSYAANVAIQEGQYHVAREWATQATTIYQQQGTECAALGPAWDWAYACGLLGDFRAGQQVCQQVLQACSGNQSLNALLLAEMQANLFHWSGEFGGAARAYRQLLAQPELVPRVRQRLRAKCAEALWRDGQQDEAQQLLRSLGRETPLDDTVPLVQGLFALASGQLEEAAAHFRDTLNRSRSRVNCWRAHLLLGEVKARSNRLDAPQQALIEAELQRVGHRRWLEFDAPFIPSLTRLGLGAEPTVLLASGPPAGRVPQGVPASADNQTTLRIETLCRPLSATLNGVAVHLPHSRVRELLVVLAVKGRSTRDELIDTLWDGQNEPKNAEYFKVLVRRLRGMLATCLANGVNPLPYEQGFYQLTPAWQVKVDVTQAQEALHHGDRAAVRAFVERYDPAALEEMDSEWGRMFASQTQDLFRSAVEWLAEHAASASDSRLAWQRQVAINPLDLDAHVQLIAAFKREKSDSGARLAYQRYAKVVQEEYSRDEIVKFEEIV